MEKYDKFTVELGRVRVAESGAIGTLKGTVAGLLIRFEVGLTVGPDDWAKLRRALDGAEAAHKAVVDHLCNPVELVP